MRQAREPVRRHLRAHKLGLVGNRVQVHMQGGDLLVEFAEDDRVFMNRTCGLYRKYYAGGKFFCLNWKISWCYEYRTAAGNMGTYGNHYKKVLQLQAEYDSL